MLSWIIIWSGISILALLDRKYYSKQVYNNRIPQRPNSFNLPPVQNQNTDEYTPYHPIRPRRNQFDNNPTQIFDNLYLTQDEQNLHEEETPIINLYNEEYRPNVNNDQSDFPFYFD